MSPRLDKLQRKKNELLNEIRSLSRKEEILTDLTEVLEEKLEAKSLEKSKPRHEVLGRFADEPASLKEQQDRMAVKEETGLLEIGLRLENRVHLNGNVVFSWSYQKLPKS